MPRPHKTKSFVIERSAPTRAAAEAVMERITTPKTWPQWQSEIVAVEGPDRLAEGDVVEGRARLLGFDVRGKTTITGATEQQFDEDVIVGVRMRISYRAEPRGDKTVVTHRMTADLPAGLAGTVLSWLLAWRLRKMQSLLLRRLCDQAQGDQAQSDQVEADPS